MMAYTWRCKGCGKTGKRPLTWEQADEGGDNHWRGLYGNLKGRQADRCAKAGHEVIPFEER